VIRIANPGTRNHKCVVLSTPESVAVRVDGRVSTQPIQAMPANRNQRRDVSLADFYQRLAKHRETYSS